MKKSKLMTALIILTAILAVFAVVVAMQPADFRVARSTTIIAPQSVVFAQVNDLHAFQEWNPWGKIDLGCKTTFEGPAGGVGAKFAWSGNNKVGEGSMTITESRLNELVRLRLDFLRPFKATNTAEFTFRPVSDQTTVTWSMTGKRNFLFKAVGLFVDCDKMIAPDFECGLASMRAIAEAKIHATVQAAR
jgi:hypothetical protein